ncbi:1-acyl-sn-glycerol-3-phosphate acyltransferase CHLREDRAFT_174358 [Selaginella moellendorffii]|uniref:1-acyl-sn-glycerol-3-phosphate acyltransferase CHLREDRAFT_174358 n=1 Tax=Selaginella moellendorffii TaxID=88036 RepID=UPI000D1C8AA4|nr:1-acyl-sn-glycerol-3-phosphate acyltransferase CHLREDRAFT_174358 [Selaginella moellendorffii]|eukprot:XP_002961230.2 1-acyl-sn-glycerol-3-phosphate acyltransferase CHLREDRAFT_174358 [Selaginella moellendorffii]
MAATPAIAMSVESCRALSPGWILSQRRPLVSRISCSGLGSRSAVSRESLQLARGRLGLSSHFLESRTVARIVARVFDQSAAGAAAAPFGDENLQGITLFHKCRAVLFYLTTTLVAIPLFLVMLLQHPLVLLLDRQRRKAQHLINKLWASASTFFFYEVEIVGKEHLPHPNEPAVYISNHQSFLDIFALFQLGRPFKFISKTSVFFIPIVGWAMYLTGHIPLHRLDAKSQLECLRRCIELLKRGVSVFFFPEGTRSTDGTLAAFKKGAFSCAAKAKVPVVPIALVGTGHLMPNGKENVLRTGKVKIVIHPRVQGGTADELCDQAQKYIVSSVAISPVKRPFNSSIEEL